MYEFVTKKEYMPIRIEVEEIIKKVQKILRKEESDMTFQFRLVGSGGKHLITRDKGGNKGYDFDYNLIINPNYEWYASVREYFFRAFQKVIKGTSFNRIENSTSVITIKQVSKTNKKVIVGCDFSIIFYPDDQEETYYKYSRFNKNLNNYTWEIRDMSKNIDDKLNWLMDNYKEKGIWNDIKEEYLKLKNNNLQDKHSYVLYHEAINNIYCRKDGKRREWLNSIGIRIVEI